MLFTLRLHVQRRSFHATRIAKEIKASHFNPEQTAERLGVTFRTPHILEQALTHKSFQQGIGPTNERLNELGRRALEFYATEAGVQSLGKSASATELYDYLQDRLRPAKLAARFDSLGLEEGVQYNLPSTPSDNVKAKVLQAVVGAVYHDLGSKAALAFTKQHVFGEAM